MSVWLGIFTPSFRSLSTFAALKPFMASKSFLDVCARQSIVKMALSVSFLMSAAATPVCCTRRKEMMVRTQPSSTVIVNARYGAFKQPIPAIRRHQSVICPSKHPKHISRHPLLVSHYRLKITIKFLSDAERTCSNAIGSGPMLASSAAPSQAWSFSARFSSRATSISAIVKYIYEMQRNKIKMSAVPGLELSIKR